MPIKKSNSKVTNATRKPERQRELIEPQAGGKR